MADEYGSWIRHEYGDLIDSLNLPEMQKRFLKTRWLDQVVWSELKAARANKMYYGLRILTLVGGASATAFASVKLSGAAAHWISALIFLLALMTTIAAGLEELMRYGESRTQFRTIAERLKQEGWLFFQLTGPYGRFPDHPSAFRPFSERTEVILGREFSPARSSASSPSVKTAATADSGE